MQRRRFLTQTLVAGSLLAAGRAFASDAGPSNKTPVPPADKPRGTPPPVDPNRPQQDPALTRNFVLAAHRDLDAVRDMAAREPRLVFAAWDTGFTGPGDWETALNAASHTGQRPIARFLLDHGARIDACCAAALGYRDVVLALLRAEPGCARAEGVHHLTLLYHIAIGGDVDLATAIKPLLPAGAPDFNQAVSAAAREGHLPMARWLLAHGATDVNWKDGFKRTPLKIALEKKHTEIAALLREAGGRE